MSATGPRQSYLLFDIGAETFAVSAVKVHEIIELPELARVPSLPPCVRGLMNLRGTVLPVVDLGTKFGQPAGTPFRRACVVVVDANHDGSTSLIGLVTPLVHDVVTIADTDIEAPPAFGGSVDAAYLAGIVRRDARFALVIDTDRVLSVDELLGTRAEVTRAAA